MLCAVDDAHLIFQLHAEALEHLRLNDLHQGQKILRGGTACDQKARVSVPPQPRPRCGPSGRIAQSAPAKCLRPAENEPALG